MYPFKKYTIIIVTIVISLLSFGCREGQTVEPPQNTPKEKLLNAYNNNSFEMLNGFFNDWNNSVLPLSESELAEKPDSVKEVYSLYKSFYDPHNLDQFGDSSRTPEVGNNFYENAKYFIIQNSVPISINSETQQATINDFRPELNSLDEKKILYFVEGYNEIFSDFMDDTRIGYNEIEARYDFLSQFIIFEHKYGFGWFFTTHPKIELINFNSDFTSATIIFRILLEGGEAVYNKQNGEWLKVSSKLTWIE